MKNKYLKTEVDKHKYCDLVDYTSKNNLKLEEDDTYYYIIEQYEKLVDGEIVDNSEEYNKKQQKEAAEREISKLKQKLDDNDYKAKKNYVCEKLGKLLPYSFQEIYDFEQPIRDRIDELEKLL